MTQLRVALEKALESIKHDEENPADLAPYGVKTCAEMSGIKCIFMDKNHAGVFEEKLLNRFLQSLNSPLKFDSPHFQADPSSVKKKAGNQRK